MKKTEREQRIAAFTTPAREKSGLPLGVRSHAQLETAFMTAIRGCTTYQNVREVYEAMEVLKERIPPQQVVTVRAPLLSAEFKYRSTPDGSPPSGRRKTGTFRDAGFSGMRPEAIDEIDCECIQQGISRAEWVTIHAFGIDSTKETQRRFYMLTEGSKDKRIVGLREMRAMDFAKSEPQDTHEPL